VITGKKKKKALGGVKKEEEGRKKNDYTPSLSQAVRIRRFEGKGKKKIENVPGDGAVQRTEERRRKGKRASMRTAAPLFPLHLSHPI